MVSSPAGPVRTPSEPRRTCVGCRVVAPRSTLLRVVVAAGSIVPDPRRVLPGRGAHVHPTAECVDRASKRRAFQRALRTSAQVDQAALAQWLDNAGDSPGPAPVSEVRR